MHSERRSQHVCSWQWGAAQQHYASHVMTVHLLQAVVAHVMQESPLISRLAMLSSCATQRHMPKGLLTLTSDVLEPTTDLGDRRGSHCFPSC